MKKQNKLKQGWHIFMQCSIDIRNDHVSAYAARSAYFLILSLIPCIILLLNFLQLTPVSEQQFIESVRVVFPDTISPLVIRIIREVFRSSIAVIPLTILVAVWSAGKGIMSLSDGLNCVHDIMETRNYFYLRIRAGIYTVFFLASLVFLLVMQVFGETWTTFFSRKAPFMRTTFDRIMNISNWLVVPVVLLMALLLYKFLPNKKIRFWGQLPGAILCLLGWMLCSYFFSYYLQVFSSFSNMYGSLTTIILIMLWFYFIMYILLLGAEANVWFKEYGVVRRLPFIGPIVARRNEAYIEKVRLHDLKTMRAREEKVKKIEEEASKQMEENE